MDTQTTEQQAVSSHKDTLLLIAAVALLLGGMFAFYYFAEKPLLVRWLAMLAGLAAGLFVAYQSASGKALWGYVTGARTELRKVVWPSRQESIQATLMIAVVVLIMAVLLWGLDSALLWGVEKLTGRGS
ncbi:preprotein translocase subunit SecE [Solimonas sp. SE-A11]|uniref:preprotein translocase subunit SecE n=1 Tax=Solimonas sp. SE-A11 TaxID=3054954 RepID=UPI00259CE5FC|nr:preprotein translocase subunit SecE [Solimonas sp. SE-A11]MDM4770239.1 preprotein translocase subunit SecE [Solimonas sp. SE-A11]